MLPAQWFNTIFIYCELQKNSTVYSYISVIRACLILAFILTHSHSVKLYRQSRSPMPRPPPATLEQLIMFAVRIDFSMNQTKMNT